MRFSPISARTAVPSRANHIPSGRANAYNDLAAGSATIPTTTDTNGNTTLRTASRIDAIDFWRGFALLSIFANHLSENIFAYVTHRNFGFSDAAELFVFLAGISVALAYGRRFLAGEPAAAVRALLRRVATIYGVQVVVSLIGIGILMAAASYLDDDDFIEDSDREDFVEEPLRGIIGVLILGHQFAFFNILPLYIVLLLWALVLFVLNRIDRRLMLAVSATLYVATHLLSLHFPTWPQDGQWFFNPLGWQLVFAIGLYVGADIGNPPRRNRWAFMLCAVVLVGAVFVLKDGFSLFPGLWEKIRLTLNPDKSDLSWLGLVHFLALAYAAYYLDLAAWLRRTPVYEPLCAIGRHSLPMFAIGAIMIVLAEVLMDIEVPEMLSGTVIVIGGAVIQYWVARRLDARMPSRHLAEIAKPPAPA